MKTIQVALDLFTTEETLKILEEVAEYVDIIELGTPLMISEGSRVITEVKEKYPDKIVFADIKVMDGGSVVPEVAFKAGADMVSVLAVAEDNTIKATIDTSKKYNGKVLVDMCAHPDISKRSQEVDKWNPDYICVHVGYDIQSTGADPIEELKKLKDVNSLKAAAGGININTFEHALESDVDNIIVGGGIYNHENPKQVAKEMREMLEKHEQNK